MKTDKIILGVDPGTALTGYGVIRIVGKELSIITLGVIDLKKYTNHYLKLKYIFENVLRIVDAYKPDEFAIEAPFYGKNVQSMLKLGRAQGVAMSAALSRSIPIFEYSPKKVKMAITGNGNASKEQLAGFLKGMLKFENPTDTFDATDALGVAVCHYYQNQITAGVPQAKSWKEFISKNPKRVVK